MAMKHALIITILSCALLFISEVYAKPRVEEGVIESVETITTEVGKDGRPLLGAAVGVGIGSAFGSGSGKTAAKVAGGLIGAKRQAKKQKKQFYGWRYIVQIDGGLQVVDTWCSAPGERCAGVKAGSQVYVVDREYVETK